MYSMVTVGNNIVLHAWKLLREQILKVLRLRKLCVYAQSCPTLCSPMDCSPPGSSVHGVFLARKRVGCHVLFQGIFPTLGMEPASPASPALTGRFFTTSATWEAQENWEEVRKKIWDKDLNTTNDPVILHEFSGNPEVLFYDILQESLAMWPGSRECWW